MSDLYSRVLGRSVHPSEPLDNVDLAKLLINNTSERLLQFKDNFDVIIKEDRSHVNNLIQTTVQGLCKRQDLFETYAIKAIQEQQMD